MRNTLDFEVFEEELKRSFTETPQCEALVERITHVLVNPNLFDDLQLEGEVRIPNLKLHEMEFLAILSWYLPKIPRWTIQLEILEKMKRYCLEDQFNLRLILSNEIIAYNFLKETSLYHPRDIFGNYLPKILKILNQIVFKKKSTCPVKEERRIGVGYKDKGSLPTSDHAVGPDESLEQLQQKYLKSKELLEDSIELMYGFLGG